VNPCANRSGFKVLRIVQCKAARQQRVSLHRNSIENRRNWLRIRGSGAGYIGRQLIGSLDGCPDTLGNYRCDGIGAG
jgi:hypothetical protein